MVVVLALAAFVVLVAAPASADGPTGVCTASYPAECQATVVDTKVACTGVGQVPDCRVS